MVQNLRPAADEIVVLLHGLLRSKTDMVPLSHYLRKRGYDTINILYPSRKMSLEALSDYIAAQITENPEYDPEKPLHFVTHSMGGLVARYYIDRYNPPNLGRVVMLAPPNQGSDLADNLNKSKILGPFYRKIYGPAALQLLTTYKHTDAPVAYPLGVITGNVSVNPLARFLLNKKHVGPHDGIVPVERTKIEGMTDHIIVPFSHPFIMFRKNVMRQVLYFLKTGSFRKDRL